MHALRNTGCAIELERGVGPCVKREIRQPHFLFLGEVLGPLEQQPLRLGQDGLAAAGLELPRLLGTDLIDGLARKCP